VAPGGGERGELALVEVPMGKRERLPAVAGRSVAGSLSVLAGRSATGSLPVLVSRSAAGSLSVLVGRSATGSRSALTGNSSVLRRPPEERELYALQLVQPGEGAHPIEGGVPGDEQHGLHRGVLQRWGGLLNKKFKSRVR
jgi:hypothetical protein